MVFEHGIGGSRDLPIALEYAIAAGCAALAVSFIVLALAWRTPRFDAATQGTPLPRAMASFLDSSGFFWALRVLGLVVAAYIGWAAVAGPDLLVNPFFGFVYVLLWVGLVPMSVLFGPFYRAVNPVRTLHLLVSRATGGNPGSGVLTLPDRVGLWPGAAGLFAFVWMELVSPDATFLAPLRLWFALYVAVVFVGATLFGDRWISAADPFEVFSTLVGHLSPFGRRADGVLVVRNPLRSLDGVPALPGLLAVVSVLFGSTAFDSFKDSPTWTRVVQDQTVSVLSVDVSLQLSKIQMDTLGLLFFVIVVFTSFGLATMFTGVKSGDSRWALPDRFAHSVVPIIVGYFVAHYLSYFMVIGKQTLVRLSDPMNDGSNYLGTANLQPHLWILLHTSFLATVKVLAIVIGHVLGVIAAHDRAVKLLPKRHQLSGQLPLLFVMVFYTITGLYLLLSA